MAKEPNYFQAEICYEHGFIWKDIEAETIDEALVKARKLVDEDNGDLAGDASNYDSVGEAQVIGIFADNGTRAVEYEYPAFVTSMRADKMKDALTKALRFIEGFEGDEMQEGIGELLAEIRAALPPANDGINDYRKGKTA